MENNNWAASLAKVAAVGGDSFVTTHRNGLVKKLSCTATTLFSLRHQASLIPPAQFFAGGQSTLKLNQRVKARVKAPLFSIITVVRNARRTVVDCLDSITSQRMDLEHIVVDGASTDGTLDVLWDREVRGLIRLISEPDKGIYDAMNKGLEAARGHIIGFLNADDIYAHADVLKRVAQEFEDDGVMACHGDLVYIDKHNPSRVTRYWRAGELSRAAFYRGWMPPHPTFFARMQAYQRYGGFNLALGSAADYELMLRFLLKHQLPARYIPEVLVKMRSGGVSNASLKSRLAANRMDRLAWQVNGLQPYPWTLTLKPLLKLPQFFLQRPTCSN